MTRDDEKLSAFLDGELSEAETREIEAALTQEPALQARLERLMAADALAVEEFALMAKEAVPLTMADAIQNAPVSGAANVPSAPTGMPGWLSAVAAMFLLLIGGAGGYFAGTTSTVQVATAPGWLQDISEYHAVYAAQQRHLVEVPAAEADHIRNWLTATLGAEVRIPDLSANGLTFEGARLLVAAGKPVAQLMYTDPRGAVVALCMIGTDAPSQDVNRQTLNGFDMVSWGGEGANYVIVGDEGRDDLSEIAAAAGTQV